MNDVEKLFSPMAGKIAWNIMRTQGSMFFVEFGDPHIRTLGPLVKSYGINENQILRKKRRLVVLYGEWTLLVQDCNWTLQAWEYSANQDATPVDMDVPFEALSGQYVESVLYDEFSRSCIFNFDLGAKLKISPKMDCDLRDKQWTLSSKDDVYVSLLNDGEIYRETGGGEKVS